VRESAAGAVSACVVVNQEFEEYFGKWSYDKNMTKNIQLRINIIRNKVLKGEKVVIRGK
jgi:hypothetical protein